METDDYIQLLLGNGYVSKYSNKSDLYVVDPPRDQPMTIYHDINDKSYRQHTGAPSNYLPTQHVLPSQQQYQTSGRQYNNHSPDSRRKPKKRKRKLDNLKEFY